MQLALTSKPTRRVRLGRINSPDAGFGAIFMRPDVQYSLRGLQ